MGEGDVQLVPPMIELFFTNRMHFQVGENENLFDFTYVGNVAHAHCLAARALLITSKAATAPLDHEKVDGEAFIITNDSPLYFWDFPRMLWKAAGSDKGIEGVWTITKDVGIPLATLLEAVGYVIGKPAKLTRKAIKFSCMTRYYNINKAKQRLGYVPLVSLKEGAERAVNYILAQRKLEAEKKAQ
jgi:sterol-4alpha-carboxylate 3-dehydrogenase (decarboxylating)